MPVILDASTLFSHCFCALVSNSLIHLLPVKCMSLNTLHENANYGRIMLMKRKEVLQDVLLIGTPF